MVQASGIVESGSAQCAILCVAFILSKCHLQGPVWPPAGQPLLVDALSKCCLLPVIFPGLMLPWIGFCRYLSPQRLWCRPCWHLPNLHPRLDRYLEPTSLLNVSTLVFHRHFKLVQNIPLSPKSQLPTQLSRLVALSMCSVLHWHVGSVSKIHLGPFVLCLI